MPAKILIVDDEAHMLRVTELSLKKGNYQVVLGRNGVQALELAEREKPDLIIMDVMMPEMDGLTSLKHLKQSPATASIPVIMLSVRGQTITREQAAESGVTVYITKPFSPSLLLAEVSRILALSNPPGTSGASPA